MSTQVQKGGAQSVDTGSLVREAKKSPLPTPPRLASAEGLSEEEEAQVRAQNRGQILHYFNQLQRLYEQGERKLKSAKYLEDVNALQTLRDPPAMSRTATTVGMAAPTAISTHHLASSPNATTGRPGSAPGWGRPSSSAG